MCRSPLQKIIQISFSTTPSIFQIYNTVHSNHHIIYRIIRTYIIALVTLTQNRINMVNSDDDNEPRGYLILRPEELRPWELFRLLFSRDIDKPRSVDSSETKEPSFRRRWLIFVSLVLLKLLRLFSELLALLGSALEFFLNFLSANSLSGFFLRGDLDDFH